MTHIVTGGAGMIGSRLVDALVAKGEKVRVIDNFSSGSMENLRESMRTGHVVVKVLDLEDTKFPIATDDVVWHLARDNESQSKYERLRSNIIIDHNVIESVRKQNPHLFVYVTSLNDEKEPGVNMLTRLARESDIRCVIVHLLSGDAEDVAVALLDLYDFMETPQSSYKGKFDRPMVAGIQGCAVRLIKA